MSTQLTCPQCSGLGLTGTVQEAVCSECKGTGLITASTDSIATTSAASATPITVTKANTPAPAAVKVASRGK